MPDSKYFVDVARDHVYQNQGEEYFREYTEWRNKENNPCGYAFRHDVREHTYIDGEGYADEFAVTSEKDALHNCFKAAGYAMLIILAFQTAINFVMHWLFDISLNGWIYYSQIGSTKKYAFEPIAIYCSLKVITYLCTIVYCIFKLKLPTRVSLPTDSFSKRKLIYGLAVALEFLVISRAFEYVIVRLFGKVNIDVCFYRYIPSTSLAGEYLFAATELLIIPILSEILYRGFILQLFRQFGDVFAIVFSSLIAACSFHDVSKMLNVFCYSVIFALIVVKTGNLFAGMTVRILIANLSFVINQLTLNSADADSEIKELLICMFLLIISTSVLIMLKNLLGKGGKIDDTTELTFSAKFKVVLNSNQMVLFLVLSLLETILAVRFIR